MHLGKFHAMINELALEYSKGRVNTQIQSVIQHLDSLAANPGNAEIANAFKTQIDALRTVLSESSLNKPYPTLAALLDSIDAQQYVGDQLFQNIEDVIAKNGMTPQLAATSLRQLLTKVAAFYQEVTAVDNAFTKLAVEYSGLESGEGEIGISIPKPEGKRLLSDLAATAKAWDRALRPFVELADPNHEPVEVRTISSSDWQFYLTAGVTVLLSLSGAVSQLNTLLQKMVETKKLIGQLVGQGMSQASTEPIVIESDNILASGTRQLAEKIVEEHHPADEGRANELKTEMTRSLGFIASQLAANVSIEIRYLPPSPPEENEDTDANPEAAIQIGQLTEVAAQIERNMDILRLDSEGRALLNLPAPNEPNEGENRVDVQ